MNGYTIGSFERTWLGISWWTWHVNWEVKDISHCGEVCCWCLLYGHFNREAAAMSNLSCVSKLTKCETLTEAMRRIKMAGRRGSKRISIYFFTCHRWTKKNGVSEKMRQGKLMENLKRKMWKIIGKLGTRRIPNSFKDTGI